MKSHTAVAKSRMRARITAGGSLLVVGALALSGCSGGNGGGSSENVTSIRVADYYTDDPAKTIIGTALDQCGTEAGVTIDRELVPSGQLVSKVLQQASSKTLPDIQMIDQSDLPTIAETGALTPLPDAGVPTDNFGAPALSAGTFKGTVYGLPPTVNAVVLYYNKDLLAAAGVTPPTTWDELSAAAKKLTTNGVYGLAFSATNDGQGVAQFLPTFWSGGADETAVDSPEAVDALSFWTGLVSDGSASQSVLTWGNSDAGDQFFNRTAAMMFNTGSQMAKLNKDTTLNYGLAQIPVKSAGDEPVSVLGGEDWTLPQTGDKARAAKAAEVLTCMLSDKTQLSLATQRGTVPGNPALDAQYLEALPALTEYVNTVNSARSRTAQLGTGWAPVASALGTAIQSSISGQASAADALKTAAGN